eukprot:12304_1
MSTIAQIDELLYIFDNTAPLHKILISKMETVIEVAKKKQIPPYCVILDVNWSSILQTLPTSHYTRSKKKLKGRDGWTIQLLSASECTKLIELTELCGYEDVGFDKEYRSNKRIQTNDPMFCQLMYDRIKPCCPQQLRIDDKMWGIYGLNERFRWCRYTTGQKFETHLDGQYTKNEEEKSFYTVNVYLNHITRDFKGGRTLFYPTSEWFVLKDADDYIIPTPGLALIFNQHPAEIHHSGEALTEGVKYLMRTDVMYKMKYMR